MKLSPRWLLLVALVACLNKATFVSITPDHGYADGCIDVVLQGHHLGTKASASIGGAEFLELTAAENDPKRPEHAQDVGFVFHGLAPAGAHGWADVEMVVDGEKLTLPDGFYYEACPASVQVDSITIPADPVTGEAAPGDPIALVGCGLSDAVSINVYEAPAGTGTGTGTAAPTPVANLPLISDCSTARVHAEVPDLPAGAYVLEVVHDDGTSYTGDCFVDSGDTGLTCIALALNIGGAR